jgi:hypothetical protein
MLQAHNPLFIIRLIRGTAIVVASNTRIIHGQQSRVVVCSTATGVMPAVPLAVAAVGAAVGSRSIGGRTSVGTGTRGTGTGVIMTGQIG